MHSAEPKNLPDTNPHNSHHAQDLKLVDRPIGTPFSDPLSVFAGAQLVLTSAESAWVQLRDSSARDIHALSRPLVAAGGNCDSSANSRRHNTTSFWGEGATLAVLATWLQPLRPGWRPETGPMHASQYLKSSFCTL